jgi:hypothetical protein
VWTISLSPLFFFMNFGLSILFFDKKMTILSRTYEEIGMFVNEWKIYPISLLGGHGNQETFTQQS